MAIYSLHHSAIGKATQERPHTAAAHVDYITRARALSRVDGERMPTDKSEAMTFLKEGEDRDRANGRVIDKLMLALPRELTDAQRAALVRGFAEDVTQGRASWLAAFHEGGKDANNPHVHLVIRDRDPKTGRRVAQLSEKGSTERLRQLWEEHANRALELAQRPERIDRRTLKAQGIDRKPTIHEGVRARRLRRAGRSLKSRRRMVRNGATARSRTRQVDYERIDHGQGREDYNNVIRLESRKRLWAAYDEDRQKQELEDMGIIPEWPETEEEEPFKRPGWLEGGDREGVEDPWLERRRKLRKKRKR